MKPTAQSLPESASDSEVSTKAIPSDAGQRDHIREDVRRYVREKALRPPQSIDDLREHAEYLRDSQGWPADTTDFITVLISNEIWRDTVAAVPFERRLLLLPQCLRNRERCPAAVDEYGLLCEGCGACVIGSLQEEAERLGYIVLVAEGTSLVIKLLEQGKIDAVIGASCLSALEKTFPHLAAGAIPGLALPLWKDGCIGTQVDVDWIREALYLESESSTSRPVDIPSVRGEVEALFAPDKLKILTGADGEWLETVGLDWLAVSGKRWRPLLTACAYRALVDESDPLPDRVRKLAVAVECFHKASLVHDDIEDSDDHRYGQRTLHRRFGVPHAINAGDFLLGEGYRMIAEAGETPEHVALMLRIAAEGHRALCLGQAHDLVWQRTDQPPPVQDLLKMFSRKTGPAFEVALCLGAVSASADTVVLDALSRYSRSLGIAYQIKDDLEDWDDLLAERTDGLGRPSVLHALAAESAHGQLKVRFQELYSQPAAPEFVRDWSAILNELAVPDKARMLLRHYRLETMRALSALENSRLRLLLRRVADVLIPVS